MTVKLTVVSVVQLPPGGGLTDPFHYLPRGEEDNPDAHLHHRRLLRLPVPLRHLHRHRGHQQLLHAPHDQPAGKEENSFQHMMCPLFLT